MEYMGEFNILQWTGEYFIQIPSGLKEKGLEAENLMEIIRDVLTSKEINQLDDMESLSASFPLKKKTAKEVMTKIAKDTADQGINFLADTLIEYTFDIDMKTDTKSSIFGELFTMIMDEEERSYIASIGKYEKDQLFFESIIPTSEAIHPYFHTEYEADFFVAHVALDVYDQFGDFNMEEFEEAFLTQIDFIINNKNHSFLYKEKPYMLEQLESSRLSYNLFTMTIDFDK